MKKIIYALHRCGGVLSEFVRRDHPRGERGEIYTDDLNTHTHPTPTTKQSRTQKMSGTQRLRIRKWDPRTIKDDRIVLFVGARGTGKSVMQMDIMQHMADRVDFGVGMTPTMDTLKEWEKHMPSCWLYEGFNQDKLEDMIDAQRRTLRSGKSPKHLCLFLDDCIYDKKVLKSVAMRDVFLNGRHLKLHMSCAVQYLMDMGPDLRTNIDYIVCMREKILANRIKLHKYFFGMFERFDDFNKVFEKCTTDFSAIVMDNTNASSNRVEDCVFWYRASPDVSDFRVGSRVFWKLSENMLATKRSSSATHEEDADDSGGKARGRCKKLVVTMED